MKFWYKSSLSVSKVKKAFETHLHSVKSSYQTEPLDIYELSLLISVVQQTGIPHPLPAISPHLLHLSDQKLLQSHQPDFPRRLLSQSTGQTREAHSVWNGLQCLNQSGAHYTSYFQVMDGQFGNLSSLLDRTKHPNFNVNTF